MAYLDSIRFSFLYIDLYSMGKTWVYPESQIPYNILRYIVAGEAEFIIDGESTFVQKNDIVYIPKGSRMSCYSRSDNFSFYSVRFTSTDLNSNEDILSDLFKIPKVTENVSEADYFKEMYHWARSTHSAKRCFVRGNLNLLIGSLALRANPENNYIEKIEVVDNIDLEKIKLRERKSRGYVDPRVQIVTDYIILNPMESYTPEIMAEMIGLSKQRFNTIFKKSVGKTPMKYVKEIRLTIAAKKLLIENKHINEIAYDVGYEDSNYFIREFKEAFGFTPNQYRKISREG